MQVDVSRKKLGLVALVAMFLIVGGGWWLFHAYRRSVVPVRPTTKIPDNIELRLDRVRFRGISDGKIIWEVIADHFDLTRDQLNFRVSGLKKVALLNDGKQELTISADTLDRNTVSGDITITGHVTLLGPDMIMRAPTVLWSDRLQVLTIPDRVSAQFGDLTVTTEGRAIYNVTQDTLRCNGKIMIGVKGSALRANGVIMDLRNQQFTLLGPVSADIAVADAEQWAAGKNLPEIPSIPAPVLERYHDYCRKQGYR